MDRPRPAVIPGLLPLAILATLAATVGLAIAADKPNIILILPDDFGYGDAGV